MGLLQDLASHIAISISLYELVLLGLVATNLMVVIVGWIVNRHYNQLRQQVANLERQMHDRWD